MAGDWIKMNKSLPRDPRVVRISSALKADRLRTIGGLLSAWCLADEQTEDGNLDGYTPDLIDEIVGMPGLALAMESVGWLVVKPQGVEFPHFTEHNGQSAKRRAQDSFRKTSARKADKCPHDKRTKSGPEKRREEKSNIPPNPQGGVMDGEFALDVPETTKNEHDWMPAGWQRMSERNRKQVRVLRNTPEMIQIGSWFQRQPGTLWTASEAASLIRINPTIAEINGMENYYTATIPSDDHRRHDLGTLLNNWSGELDRARKFATSNR